MQPKTRVVLASCSWCKNKRTTHRVEKSGHVRSKCLKCEAGLKNLRKQLANVTLRVDKAVTKLKTPAAKQDGELVIGLFDWHFPYHDQSGWSSVLEWIRENKPSHIVLGGDHGDWLSVSTHAEFEAEFKDDVAAVAKSLDQLKAAAPNSNIYLLQGNHETMLSRTISQRYPSLASSLSLPEALKLEQRGIKWIDEFSQPLRLGKLHIIHGHQELRGKTVPKYPGVRFEKYVPAAGDTLWFGHIHKFGMISVPRYGGQASIHSSGCGRIVGKDHKANSWLHGEESGWQNGFLVGRIWSTGRITTTQISMEHGQFEWGGKLYGRRGGSDGKAKTSEATGETG